MTRVGVIGPLDPDEFADNVLDALPRLGVTAVGLGAVQRRIHHRFDSLAAIALRASPRLELYAQRQLTAAACNQGLDLVISVDGRLRPETVAAVQAAGAKVVLWYPDAVANFGRQLMLLAPYDRVYIKEPLVVPRLADLLGLPVSYLPEACNPRWHRPIGDPASNPKVVVAGNMYPSRVLLLNRLLRDGVPLQVYGGRVAPWIGPQPSSALHTGKYIAREEKAKVFREAAAVLNNLHPAEFDGVNCRLFEATASGAAVLADYRPVIDDLFDESSELFCYRTYDELLAQIRFLLEQSGEGARRGDLASERAHAEHSYEVRLRAILEDVLP